MSKFDVYAHMGITDNGDGTIIRNRNMPEVEANPEPVPGNPIVCKDVTLNPNRNTKLRVFRPVKLPSNDNTIARVPIIIYFHGGGFVLYSAFDSLCHQNCSQLASETPAIAISVDYRLAPEHRLPACYEDAVDAILWVKQQALDPQGEEWIKNYVDVTRCYLAGRGNGGNIIFHTMLRVMDLDITPVKIAGLVFNQPMFSGVNRTRSEIQYAADHILPLPALDTLWELALPKGTDRDHRFSNIFIDGPHKSKLSSFPRCLVIGFGFDPMFDRQQDLVQMLALNGVQVEAQFDDSGFHSIDFVDKHRGLAVLKITKDFII